MLIFLVPLEYRFADEGGERKGFAHAVQTATEGAAQGLSPA